MKIWNCEFEIILSTDQYINSDTYKTAKACNIFDPLVLKDIAETEIVTVLYGMAENIFRDDFIDRLKREMPSVVKEAKRDHILDNIQGSRQYFTRMQHRMKRYNVADKESMDWKNDAG